MDSVSIIIPCYRQAQYLPEAIESALAQTKHLKEVVVVNDGSDDNTSEVASKYPVKLIVRENGGLPAARNTGVANATGQYILPLDADDWIDPKYLEKTVGLGDFVGVGTQEFGLSDLTYHPLPNPTLQDFMEFNRVTCCSLYKRSVWEKVGGYDEDMRLGYEDYDFNLRVAASGMKIVTIPDLLFHYRVKENSMVTEARSYHKELMKYMLDKLSAID